jgi:hypothetical protein
MAVVRCTKCRTPLPDAAYVFPEMSTCPGCEAAVAVAAFPALLRSIQPGQDGQRLLVDSESSCFYHPDKKAVVPCDACGRFLCSLCDLEIDDRHLCPTCLETGKRESTLKSVENHRTLHDNIALYIAVVPIVFVWLTAVTAPTALGYSFYAWKKPSSIVPRTKARLIVAIVLSLLQIVGWVVLIVALAGKF